MNAILFFRQTVLERQHRSVHFSGPIRRRVATITTIQLSLARPRCHFTPLKSTTKLAEMRSMSRIGNAMPRRPTISREWSVRALEHVIFGAFPCKYSLNLPSQALTALRLMPLTALQPTTAQRCHPETEKNYFRGSFQFSIVKI